MEKEEIKKEILDTLKSAVANEKISKFKNERYGDNSIHIDYRDNGSNQYIDKIYVDHKKYLKSSICPKYIENKYEEVKSLKSGEKYKARFIRHCYDGHHNATIICDKDINLYSKEFTEFSKYLELHVIGKSSIKIEYRKYAEDVEDGKGIFVEKRIIKDRKYDYYILRKVERTLCKLTYNGFNYDIEEKEAQEIFDLIDEQYIARKIKDLKEIQEL